MASYEKPGWVDSGSINLRPSQEGALGLVGLSQVFETWWEAEIQPNITELQDVLYPGFEYGDASTYPDGFDPAKPDTWYLLFS